MPVFTPAYFTQQNKTLYEGNFNRYIRDLYLLGFSLQKSFKRNQKKRNGKNLKIAFRKFILDKITAESTESLQLTFNAQDYTIRLWNLLCFVVAWEDQGLSRDRAQKQLRQQIKHKRNLDRTIRQAIHAGLYAETVRLIVEIWAKEKTLLNANPKLKELAAQFEKLAEPAEEAESVNQQLINIISTWIQLLSEPEANRISSIPLEKQYANAARAIAFFKATPEKLLHSASLLCAFLSGLACGFISGGCIYLFLIGGTLMSPIAIMAISSLIFIAGFYANYRYFSKHISEFLLTCLKDGGVTEFVDTVGVRAQMSSWKKFFLIPALFVSLAVGISVAAFTVMSGVQIITTILPFLILLSPQAAAILLGVLAAVLCMSMSIIMFKAFVGVVSAFSFKTLYQTFASSIEKLSFINIVSYVIKAGIIGFSLFGLYYLCFAALSTLGVAFGPVLSLIVGWASFLGQIPFTIVTANAFCNFLGEFLTAQIKKINIFSVAQFEINVLPEKNESLLEKDSFFYSLIHGLYKASCIIFNALGNGILVVHQTVSSYLAGGACTFNSIACNLIHTDQTLQEQRDAADRSIIETLKKLESVTNARQDSQEKNTHACPENLVNKNPPPPAEQRSTMTIIAYFRVNQVTAPSAQTKQANNGPQPC
jgi:hypothetical protein